MKQIMKTQRNFTESILLKIEKKIKNQKQKNTKKKKKRKRENTF